MFGWEFPPYNSGGLGEACLGLTQALSKIGVEITFVLPRQMNLSVDYMKILNGAKSQNLRFLEIDSLLTGYSTITSYKDALATLTPNSQKRYAGSLIEEVFRYGEEAVKIVGEEDFDIIHAHDWLTFLAANKMKDSSKKPLISQIHATEYDRSGSTNPNRLVKDIEYLGMKAADQVVAVSNYTKNVIANNYDIDSGKINVIHNGVNAKDFSSESSINDSLTKFKELGFKIVLFLGRITLQKGPEYFIDVAKKVLEFRPNTIFIMAGDGDKLTEMIRKASDLKISDKILFPGFVRESQRTVLYKMADLFILPSVSEPFGIVPLEAMINDTPVIISKQSGVSEVIRSALKVDFWDINEMTNKIVSVLNHTVLHNNLQVNGLIEAKEVTWDKAAEKTKKLYLKLG